MSFEKFKELKPLPMAAPKDADGYSEKLLLLKSRPSARKIVSMVSYAAAAVLIVTAVSLWAIIGRGIRTQGQKPTQNPAGITQSNNSTLKKDASITTLQREQFFNMFAKFRVDAIPEFSEGETPDIEDMKWYFAHIYQNELNGGEFSAELFENEMTQKFGLEYDLLGQDKLSLSDGQLREYPFAELIEYSENEGVVTATAAVYYVWNLTDQNCAELFPDEYATAKSAITAGSGNVNDIHAIYKIKYTTNDGITPQRFISVEKYTAPSDKYTAYFESDAK